MGIWIFVSLSNRGPLIHEASSTTRMYPRLLMLQGPFLECQIIERRAAYWSALELAVENVVTDACLDRVASQAELDAPIFDSSSPMMVLLGFRFEADTIHALNCAANVTITKLSAALEQLDQMVNPESATSNVSSNVAAMHSSAEGLAKVLRQHSRRIGALMFTFRPWFLPPTTPGVTRAGVRRKQAQWLKFSEELPQRRRSCGGEGMLSCLG